MSEQPPRNNKQHWIKLERAQLDEVIAGHEQFLNRVSGGTRALLQFHDLSELDLRRVNLSDVDLTAVLLNRATMDGANLSGTNLFAADMRVARLVRVDLSGTDLRGACMRGADMTEAKLSSIDAREGRITQYAKPEFNAGNGRTDFSCVISACGELSSLGLTSATPICRTPIYAKSI